MWPASSATAMFCIGTSQPRVAAMKASTESAVFIARVLAKMSWSVSSAVQRSAMA